MAPTNCLETFICQHPGWSLEKPMHNNGPGHSLGDFKTMRPGGENRIEPTEYPNQYCYNKEPEAEWPPVTDSTHRLPLAKHHRQGKLGSTEPWSTGNFRRHVIGEQCLLLVSVPVHAC